MKNRMKMKRIWALLITFCIAFVMCGSVLAAPGESPAGEETMQAPEGESGGESAGESEGESGGGSEGGSAAVEQEDDGIDAVITFYDEGETPDREQKEGFSLEYYENGLFDESGITGFLFTSEDPTVNFYFSELSENTGDFFQIGGTAENITTEATGKTFSAPALTWMEDNQIRSYDSAVILGDGGSEDSCEPVISAKGWTCLDIDHVLMYIEGNSRSAVYSDVVGGSTVPGPGAGGGGQSQTPVVVIRNSLIETTGQSTADIDSAISVGNSGGRARGIQPQGMSVTYLYNTAIVSRTWGAYSTDSARQNLDLVSYNSMGYSTNGYGAYADTSCHLYLYGSNVIGSNDGITASNNGEIYAVSLNSPLTSTDLRALMGKTASSAVSPADYLPEGSADAVPEDKETVIAGGNCAVQFHMPDQMHSGAKNTQKATLYMDGGTLLTDESYLNGELSAYTARYSGALLVTKSTQTNVLLTGTELNSSCGVLIHSMINSDTNVNNIADGDTALGSDYVFRDMDVTGDVINEDYQRALRLTLDAATLTGAIQSKTCEDWNSFAQEELDGQYILNPDGYQTLWGVELTLTNAAVWNVTETSTLTALHVEDGCTINGTVTENEDGTITVEPAQ